jgi:FixJ family two-component response regulator
MEERRLTATALISVIDDDDSLRIALMGLMRSLGHRVEGFASAEAFLEADLPETSDCIVTDIQMPGLSGIDLKHRLDDAGSTVPVIMITARPEPLLHARALESGAFCLLKKPFDLEEFIGCLDRALDSPAAAAAAG